MIIQANRYRRDVALAVWVALVHTGSATADLLVAETNPHEQAVQSEAPAERDSVETRGLAPIPQKSQPNTAKAMQEPSWPQPFDVRGPETDSFGFAVTQPGPIVIDVQSQGPPITVTLRGAGVPPQVQTGIGQIRLHYQATSQDVAKGMFWGISIGLQQPGPAQAVGQVMVQHPPADPSKVQSAAVAQQQAGQQQAAQRQGEMQQAAAQAAAQIEVAFQQRKTQFEQQQQLRHAALMAKAQPLIDQLRMRGPGQVRTRGIEESETVPAKATPEALGEIETRGFSGTRPSGGVMQPPASTLPMMKMPQQQAPIISQQMQSTSSPLTYMPDPIITSLSVTQGQPGDPVMINGSGFGDEGGEVHFVIGPGKDFPAPAGIVWRNDQIFATVPDATGVLVFNGTVYIQRITDRRSSNLAGFRFEPSIEMREYRLSDQFTDVTRKVSPMFSWFTISNEYQVFYQNSNIFWGWKETDEYFLTTRLKNGWVLDEVFFRTKTCDGGCNYLIEKHIGSDRPYFAIRYWLDAGIAHGTSYLISRLTIRGPKGMPDGLVVP